MATWLATQAGGGHATGPAAGGAWLDLLLSAWHQPHVCHRGRVILSPPVMWLLSPLFSLTACFGDGRRLFGFALPSTIPPLGAMGVPWLLWGEGARKRLCRTNKQALEKWIKQYLDLKKKKGNFCSLFSFMPSSGKLCIYLTHFCIFGVVTVPKPVLHCHLLIAG